MEVAEAIRLAIAANALGDSYVLTLLRHKRNPGNEQGLLDIREELARYTAKQPPLSRYDEVLGSRKGVLIS